MITATSVESESSHHVTHLQLVFVFVSGRIEDLHSTVINNFNKSSMNLLMESSLFANTIN